MDNMDKIDLTGLTVKDIQQELDKFQVAGFRGKQIFQWMWQKRRLQFSEMSNLPNQLIELLSDHFRIGPLETLMERKSNDGTNKYLFQLIDNHSVETVLIPESSRNTLCISSQVGCAMGCSFCATGKAGFIRNLTSGEISAQALWVQALLGEAPLTNLVFMGMGEPFNNYDNLLKAIAILNDPLGLNIGMRRVTVSTCGIAPRIVDFARDCPQAVLAISLHAATDRQRATLMPITRKYPLAEVIKACREYVRIANRRISFEYALIHGFNDTPQDLTNIASLLADLPSHINLIPVNPVDPTYQRPTTHQIKWFASEIPRRTGVSVSVRSERGTDIEAACGQLRQRQEELR